jgi:hypothetical protein
MFVYPFDDGSSDSDVILRVVLRAFERVSHRAELHNSLSSYFRKFFRSSFLFLERMYALMA